MNDTLFGIVMGVFMLALVVWATVWKALALWRAARNGHTAWFVFFFLVSTVGLLEIPYLYIWGKKKEEMSQV